MTHLFTLVVSKPQLLFIFNKEVSTSLICTPACSRAVQYATQRHRSYGDKNILKNHIFLLYFSDILSVRLVFDSVRYRLLTQIKKISDKSMYS